VREPGARRRNTAALQRRSLGAGGANIRLGRPGGERSNRPASKARARASLRAVINTPRDPSPATSTAIPIWLPSHTRGFDRGRRRARGRRFPRTTKLAPAPPCGRFDCTQTSQWACLSEGPDPDRARRRFGSDRAQRHGVKRTSTRSAGAAAPTMTRRSQKLIRPAGRQCCAFAPAIDDARRDSCRPA